MGIQPDAAGTDVPTDQGYPDQLASMLDRRGQDLRLVKLGCSGETTVTLIDGGICTYRRGRHPADRFVIMGLLGLLPQ